MATTSDDGFHEIQLNGKQLVFLFMAVTVVSVVIFLCGVLVGRGVPAEAAPADQFATAGLDGEAPPLSEPAPVAVQSDGDAPATANEDLSYPDRLSGPPPANERLRVASEPAPEPTAPPAPAPAPEAPPAAKAAPVDAPPATPAPAEPAGAGFAIQVAALSARPEADAVARRLSGKGYPAYVLAPAPGTPAVFRVRVGKYPDRRAAESVAARLEKEEQFKPWIVR